jgi:hypothetical protein
VRSGFEGASGGPWINSQNGTANAIGAVNGTSPRRFHNGCVYGECREVFVATNPILPEEMSQPRRLAMLMHTTSARISERRRMLPGACLGSTRLEAESHAGRALTMNEAVRFAMSDSR